MKRKQNILGIFAAVLVVGGVISGCSLYKKSSPTAPDYSKPNTATATFTPTQTGIYTSTKTLTPTITFTPTITATPTITNTHVSATDTVTNTPTITFTSTMTPTFTVTATACTQGSLQSVYTFDNTTECWMAKEGYGQVTGSTLSVSRTAPYSGTGCLSMLVPFTGTSQQVQPQIEFAGTTVMTGKAIRCRVKVSTAVKSSGTCTVKLFEQSTSGWTWEASGDFILSDADTWVSIGWTPSYTGSSTDVKCIGLQIFSGGSGSPTTGEIFIDQFEIYDTVPTSTPTITPTPGGVVVAGWHFDSDITGWGMDGSGTSAAVSVGSVVVWDGTVDADSTGGSVSIYAPFTTIDQTFLLADSFNSTPINLSGKAISVKVRVDSWTGPALSSNPGVAWIVLKSTKDTWIAAQGAAVNLDSTGSWITLTIPNASTPYQSNPNYDATQIIQAAVVIESPGAGTVGAAVFHVDDWLYQ